MTLSPNDVKAQLSVQWPRPLRTPAQLMEALRLKTKLSLIKSPICSKIILQLVGSWAYLTANILNKSRVFNIDTLNQEIDRIHRQAQGELEHEKKSPLLTLSNHISCVDDPVLWGALIPFFNYSTRTEAVRWSAAAVDICFSKPWHSTFFALGKTFPIVRGVGLNQPGMDFASGLLQQNHWLHLFPEGRVMRDDNQNVISNKDKGYIFKWGVAKLILDYFNNPKSCDTRFIESKSLRILPFYHLGLDEILPIGWPYIPRIGKQLTIFIRPKVIDFNAQLLNKILARRVASADQKLLSDEDLDRIKVTNYLEEEVEKLAEPANRLHATDT